MAQSILRAKYQHLSREELLNKAYELGSSYEMKNRSCSQSTVAAMYCLLKIPKVLIKVASSSSGGQAAQAAGTCGGLIGGTMVLDYFFGRPQEKLSYAKEVKDSLEVLRTGLRVARLLYNEYVTHYGTILCPYIQTQLFGRSYVLSNPEELKKFDELGAHSDPAKCGHIVGNAARWVMAILIDEGVVQPEESSTELLVKRQASKR